MWYKRSQDSYTSLTSLMMYGEYIACMYSIVSCDVHTLQCDMCVYLHVQTLQCSQYGLLWYSTCSCKCMRSIDNISVHTCNMYTINFVHITSLSTPHCIILHHLVCVCESVAYQWNQLHILLLLFITVWAIWLYLKIFLILLVWQ